MEALESPGIPVIYQDHHLLVVNKPAGLVIHPTYKHADGTMWDTILEMLAQQGSDEWQPPDLPDKPGWEGAPVHIREMLRKQQRMKYAQEEGPLPRPCLLHRLDKDTSGVVVLARTERSRRHLSRQFQEHSIVKRYLAVIGRGAPEWALSRGQMKLSSQHVEWQTSEADASLFWTSAGEITLEGPLQRDPRDRRRCIVGPQGQQAKTVVRTLAANETVALLEARPVTGRTHQIRAHLAAAGCAIVGDKTYGLPAWEGLAEGALHRQFLHAYSLELRRYPDNVPCSFFAPLPEDLVAWLAKYLPGGTELAYAGDRVRASDAG
jgi:23S rRNA-/tRNA-specific pseudouridylate synthase